ncbi:DNA recombination protein [Fusarium tjaetaba]|uniref:DNA recombination protein n=1 Tax=Fusarium tjaetaba TaxID=1567544 RepID=A0A8H5S3B4_9HYPO|nr:DNA recombination protein [Fusarium tjaetaba]KAF5646090.1 DNA recombination protein [Fusarium tjaetaba]
MGSLSIDIPHLRRNENSKQLIVNGCPFLMRAGELQNSSLSSVEYMEPIWQKMVDTNINTLLGSVTWEMIEPEEDVFDFSVLDEIIIAARKHSMHLVLLWFGSFKNGNVSLLRHGWQTLTGLRSFDICAIVDQAEHEAIPRAKLRKAGGRLEAADVVSIFHPECRKADTKAFGALMQHLREFDEPYSTVIMVQVENESGLLGDSRDGSELAEQAFRQPVPRELLDFLTSSWESLHEDMKTHNLAHFDPLREFEGGDWETVFGSSPHTDELFMAYHYALYVNQVAAAGKAQYPIPHYTNMWMNYAGDDSDNDFPVIVGGGDMPGDYPSGGAVSNVMDIWMQFAPNLDFLGPDIYLNDYGKSCAKYRHRNQPLFVPEMRRDEYGVRRIWIAFGSHAAIGTSPFGVDTVDPADSPLTKHYALLKSVSAIILEAQRQRNSSVGFCFDEIASCESKSISQPIKRSWGGFDITIDRCFVFGKAGTGSGMVIHRGGGKFLLIGWGFHVSAKSTSQNATFTGILKFEEKAVDDEETGSLRTVRVLNGDETRSGSLAMMPNEDPDYGGFPISVTIPARTMIAEVTFYSVSE